ncbi:hypothetical protein AB0M20_43220, partial [Actinoplanes sp. NPDC051633]
MTMTTGLGGEPRGPDFLSPGFDDRATGGGTKGGGGDGRHASPRDARRWPLLAAAGVAVIAVAAGSGGLAGYYSGAGDEPAEATDPAAAPAPAPAGVPSDLVGAAARALPGVVSVRAGQGSGSGFVFDSRG